ncbi:MAG: transporter [Pseudomonadota bacterium]|nr:transporter [Pseudomonadota bacterium]
MVDLERSWKWLAGWVCLIGGGWVAPSLAGPPFITNDPDPPEIGQWELILPATLKRNGDGRVSGELVTIDVNYGYDRYTQLSVELPIPYAEGRDGTRQFGVGDVLMEYKRRFGTDETQGYLGINPQITLPTGSERHGLGTGRVTLQLPLLYQRRWGDNWFYGDLRYKWHAGEEGKSYWFLGVALERRLNEKLKLGAELFGTTPQSAEDTFNLGFNLGGRYRWDPERELIASIGRSIFDEPDLTLLIGVKIFISP